MVRYRKTKIESLENLEEEARVRKEKEAKNHLPPTTPKVSVQEPKEPEEKKDNKFKSFQEIEKAYNITTEEAKEWAYKHPDALEEGIKEEVEKRKSLYSTSI